MNLERSSQYNAITIFDTLETNQSSQPTWILDDLDYIIEAIKSERRSIKVLSTLTIQKHHKIHSKFRYRRTSRRPVISETE